MGLWPPEVVETALTLISLRCQCHENKIWVGHHWRPIIYHSHRLIPGKDWTRLLIFSVHLSIVTCYRRVGGVAISWVSPTDDTSLLVSLSFEKLRLPKALVLWEQHANYYWHFHYSTMTCCFCYTCLAYSPSCHLMTGVFFSSYLQSHCLMLRIFCGIWVGLLKMKPVQDQDGTTMCLVGR